MKRATGYGVVFAIAIVGSTSRAQGINAAVAAPDSSAGKRTDVNLQLDEIVVTAEKRTERIQDTPISVSAISGAELAAQGITNAADAVRQVPGVALTSAGPGQTEYTIRGLSSSGPAVATVGFYLDDAPMTAPSVSQNGHVSIDPDLYDLERVEVLRGPQGTLYGSGSMGGTVKLITNQPQLDVLATSAAAEGSHTEGGGWNERVSAMLNLPIVDGKLAIRLVGTADHRSGWIDRIVLNDFPLPTNPQPQCAPFAGCTRGNVLAAPVSANYHDVNDKDLTSARIGIRYQATDDFKVTTSGFYQKMSLGGLDAFDNPPGTVEANYQPYNVPEPFSDTFSLANVVAEYSLSAFTVTSATSYWSRKQSQSQESTETLQTTFDLASYSAMGPSSVTELDTTKQFSEEIRLTSRGNNRFQWLIGGFYSNYNYGQNQYNTGAGIDALFGSPNLFSLLINNNLKQVAAFGEASYKMTDKLKATIGLRRYSYSQHSATTLSGALAPTLEPETTFTSASNAGLNPKYTLSYDFNPDLMVYTTAAKGFRPGNGNEPVPLTGPDTCLPDLEALGKTQAPPQYNPDSVWSYEFGEKATLFERRVSISSAIYFERWSQVQQNVSLACGFSFIGNVGTADVKGGEVEIAAKVTPSLTLSQSGGYTHAIFTASVAGTGVSPGDDLQHVPEYTATTSLVYSTPINDSYTLVARASNVLIAPTKVLTYFLNELPGYDIVKFRVGLDTARWSSFLYVDNLTDRRAFIDNIPNYFLNIPSLNRVATNQPRTIGLAFEFKH